MTAMLQRSSRASTVEPHCVGHVRTSVIAVRSNRPVVVLPPGSRSSMPSLEGATGD